MPSFPVVIQPNAVWTKQKIGSYSLS